MSTQEGPGIGDGTGGGLRYLSPEWFEQLDAESAALGDHRGGGGADASRPVVVLQQVVTGTPFGDVRYRVEIRDGQALLLGPATQSLHVEGSPVVTITSDWETACSVASGKVSAHRALIEGRLKVRWRVPALAALKEEVRRGNGTDAVLRNSDADRVWLSFGGAGPTDGTIGPCTRLMQGASLTGTRQLQEVEK